MSSERIEVDRGNIIAFSPKTGKPHKPQSPKQGRFRLLPHFLIFAALIAVGFFIVRPASLALRQRMDSLRDQLLSSGEALIGRRIEYEFLEPSFLGGLEVRSLTIRGEGQEPLVSVDRLNISWSLWDLLRGNEGFPRIRALRLERPRVYFDYNRDRDLVELLSRLNGTAATPVSLSFRIRDGSFALEGLGRLDRVDLDAEIRGEWIDVQGALNADLSLAGPDSPEGGPLGDLFSSLPAFLKLSGLPSLNLSTSARFRLSCDTAFSEGKAYLSVPFVVEDHFRTGALAVDMELRNRVFSLSNAASGGAAAAPVIFSLDYGLDTGEFSAELSCRDYSPGDYLQLTDSPLQGSLQDYGSLLAIRSSGEAHLGFAAGKLDYRTDLRGLIPPNLPLGGSGFRVKLEGDKDYVRFDQVELTLTRGVLQDRPGGIIGFRGDLDLAALRPRGTLSVRDFSLTGEGGISAQLALRSQGDEFDISGESLSIGDAVFHDLELDLHRENGGFNFSAGIRRSYGEDDTAVIQADGTFDFAPRHLEARLTLDSFSTVDVPELLSPLVPKEELRGKVPAPIADLAGGLLQHSRITTEIFATTDFEQLLYNAPRLVISYSGGRDVIALFSVSGTDRHFMVDGGQILWDGGNGQITGQSDFSNPDNVSFALNIGYRDMNYSLEGNILDRNSLELWGSYGINAFMVSTGDGAYSGRAGGENVPVPLGERIARLTFNTSIRYLSSKMWSAELVNLELADIPGFIPGNTDKVSLLRIAGEANQDRVLLREIYYDDSLGILRGGGSFAVAGDAEGVRRGNMYAFDEDIGESYDLDIALYPGDKNLFSPFLPPGIGLPSFGELRIRASGAGMRLDRFSAKIPNTLADGNLNLTWKSLEDFSARLDVSSLSTNQGGQAVNASGRVFLDYREFRIENLHLTLGNLEAMVPRIRIDLAESQLEGGGRIWGKISERDIGLDVSLASRFASIDSWQGYKTALENFRGSLRLSNIAIDGQNTERPFDFTFSREGEGLIFSGGPQNMVFFNVKSGGGFVAAFAEPFPLRGVFEGTLNSSSIDAKGEGIFLDLATVWKFLPVRKDFNIAAGNAVASLQIRGPLGDPEIYGSARGENLRMQVPAFLPDDIIPTRMDLIFDGNEMRFTDVSALCGRGTGVVSGRFWLEKWIPSTFSLDITSGRERPLPFRFDINGILARGTVSGALNINLMDLTLNVSGDLVAQETEISLNAAEIAAAQNNDTYEDAPVITDITITTGRKVEFLWPTREFPMIQAYADLGAKARIYANSMDRSFSFTGDIKLRGGEIFYFERSFYIRSGTLSFREDQNQFDPRITVRAEARDRSSTGPVTISLVVDNAPLQSFTPRFESSPALSQMEIMSLMGQSLVGTTGEDGSVPFLASSADLLAQSQVMRRIQGALRDFLHLDMFSIRTQFLQRAAFSIMGIQGQTVDRIGWVGNYFDNTSVFVGKYIGSDMFAQLMVSLRYDEKKRTFGGYTFEPDFGIELRSPLGNIQWNLVPSHPENWYINDNSFSISWNFSF